MSLHEDQACVHEAALVQLVQFLLEEFVRDFVRRGYVYCDFVHCAFRRYEDGRELFAFADDGERGVWVKEGVAEDVLREVVDTF